jgi:diguanylate cyclase (GGDEF)-like protein
MGNRTRIFAFHLALFLSVFPLFGESAPFRFHSVHPELPSMSISSIAQDSRGFLWFGTQAGLFRYDGDGYEAHTAVPFEENTLSSNLVQTMLMDADDALWVGTYAGLDRYDIPTGNFTHYSVGSDVIVSILKDSGGNVWAGTLDGLGRMAPGADAFTVYRKESADRFIGSDTVRGLFEDRRGVVYACTYDGLWQYDPLRDTFVLSDLLAEGNPCGNGIVYGIVEDASGDYWVSRWGTGLVRIDATTRAYKVFPLADNRIYSLNISLDDRVVLAGTWGGGLNVLDKKTGKVTVYRQTSPQGQRLSNDIVYSLFVDKAGLLWLGTNGGGLNLYDPAHSWFSSVDATSDDSLLPSGKITGLLIGKDGDIWVGVTNKGITRIDPDAGTFRHYRHEKNGRDGAAGARPLPDDAVYCMYRDSRDAIHIGTNTGLYTYDPAQDRFVAPEWTDSIERVDGTLMVSCVGETRDGSLWFGTWDGGLYRYMPQFGKYVRYRSNPDRADSLSDNLIYFLAEDSTGALWVSTNRGLNRCANQGSDSFERYVYDVKNRKGISGNTVYCMYEHTDGTIWFGTRNGGVSVWHPDSKTFTHVTSADGLPSDTIVGICPASGDGLWLATQNGLVRYDIGRKSLSVYRTSDGLLSQMFNLSYWLPGDDRRFFGTPSGLVWFNEADVRERSSSVPPVAITSVTVNNQRIAIPYAKGIDVGIKLSSDQRNISIGYSPLDFSPLAHYTCSYLLEGYDREWNSAGDRGYAMYTNLFPGKYRFRIRVDTAPGQLSPEETVMTFAIRQPLFLRWYAIIAYLLLAAVASGMVIRYRKAVAIERKFGELEATANDLQTENRQLERLSYLDSLTGIPNRRYFESVIAREWETSLVCGEPLSVLIVDIDFFKLYNDTFGHPEGDRALRAVAKALSSAMYRVSDTIARYGGEEFVIVLHDATSDTARLICSRLMDAAANCHIPFHSSIADYLTVSVGSFSGVPDSALTAEKFIFYADKALYSAKETGRNRYVIYTNSDLGL